MEQSQPRADELAARIIVTGATPSKIQEVLKLLELLEAEVTPHSLVQIEDLATECSDILPTEVCQAAGEALLRLMKKVSSVEIVITTQVTLGQRYISAE